MYQIRVLIVGDTGVGMQTHKHMQAHASSFFHHSANFNCLSGCCFCCWCFLLLTLIRKDVVADEIQWQHLCPGSEDYNRSRLQGQGNRCRWRQCQVASRPKTVFFFFFCVFCKLKRFVCSSLALQIWDTAGQERFRSMTSAFYSRAQGVIISFDVSQRESFNSIPNWIRDIRKVPTAHKSCDWSCTLTLLFSLLCACVFVFLCAERSRELLDHASSQ